MGNSTTLKDEYEAQVKPRKGTVQFILDYSKALEVKSLRNGMQINLLKN